MRTDIAKKWLKSYMRLKSYGFVGRFLSKEAKIFKDEKTENDSNILEFCVRKALEALN